MWNVYAFFKNLAASQVYAKVSATADPVLPQDQNGNFIPRANEQIFAAIVAGVGVTAAQINTPKLRQVTLPEIYPPNVSATLLNPPPFAWYDMYGPNINAVDPLAVGASTYGTGASDVFAALFSRPQKVTAPKGPVFVVPCTFSITTVKGAWVNGPIVFPTNLPYGSYSIVGMRVQTAGALAARLYIPGGADFRPGVICDGAYGNYQIDDYWQMGNAGLYGVFKSTAQPTLDLFGLAAGAQTGVCFLNLIYNGPGS
jgi:hypothetical protein